MKKHVLSQYLFIYKYYGSYKHLLYMYHYFVVSPSRYNLQYTIILTFILLAPVEGTRHVFVFPFSFYVKR